MHIWYLERLKENDWSGNFLSMREKKQAQQQRGTSDLTSAASKNMDETQIAPFTSKWPLHF